MARKRNTLGCLFYVALVLLVLVVFLFNRQRMQEVIDKTGLARLFKSSPRSPSEVVITPLPEPPQPETRPEAEAPAPAAGPGPQPEPPAGRRSTPATPPAAEPSREVVVRVEEPAAEKREARTRRSRLFFVVVGADGQVSLKGVVRPVQYVDAPLTATLQALLDGPTAAERSQGLISLVSADTRLRGVTVQGDTAVVDFSEAFRFSSLGKEGLRAGLEQVVYTATEFSNVKKVKILIEGRPTNYLGPEGLFVGEPVGREAFAR